MRIEGAVAPLANLYCEGLRCLRGLSLMTDPLMRGSSHAPSCTFITYKVVDLITLA